MGNIDNPVNWQIGRCFPPKNPIRLPDERTIATWYFRHYVVLVFFSNRSPFAKEKAKVVSVSGNYQLLLTTMEPCPCAAHCIVGPAARRRAAIGRCARLGEVHRYPSYVALEPKFIAKSLNTH